MSDVHIEDARWRQEHEVRALLDTLSIYRRCVVDLASENTRLRDEVAVLRAIRANNGHAGTVVNIAAAPRR